MKIIYVHGLDSSSNSIKGRLLQEYCSEHYPDIKIMRPDLNDSPDIVFRKLCAEVQFERQSNNKIMLIGSSLGGYFSSLVSNETGCPALLLNPSTQPHISLQRFAKGENLNKTLGHENSNLVLYRTEGGWALTIKDLKWFNSHRLTHINFPKQVYAIINTGDELLDPVIAETFYRSQGAMVELQQGGDHRMSDFADHLPKVMSYIKSINNEALTL